MTTESQRAQRKSPIHLPVQLEVNRSPIVFLTACTEKRKPILCREEAHRALVEAWGRADAWCVGRYVIMPDHVHLFCAPARWDGLPITKWVQYWKSLVSRGWPWPEEHPLWQKSCWDRQLRRGEQYAAKWEYVRNNPVRKGLAAEAVDWPFQGELHVLVWEG